MGKAGYSTGNTQGWFLAIFALLLVVAIGASTYVFATKKMSNGGLKKPQQLMEVKVSKEIKDSYDVIVVGTDPEGLAAAISASRNGLKTLLVDGQEREQLGGLMTVGWLNSLDMNYEPSKGLLSGNDIMNKGLFSEWYSQIEGDSFDVVTAANVFADMVSREKNIDLMLKAQKIEPQMSTKTGGALSRVAGVVVTKADGTKKSIEAKAVIDATQDGDIAAAAGVPFTIGREDLADPKSRMAVTAVFRLNNITPERWASFAAPIQAEDKGTGSYGINEMSLWGLTKMQDYPAFNKERVRMRGLNGGRQNDNTMLVNALQIFNVDPFSPKSRQEAFQIAQDELPHVLAYLKQMYPEFEGVELAGIAPELYVRESRHMQGEYRLSIIDLLENRDQWDRIAFGGYPVDIQRTSPRDNGAVVIDPEKYAVPYRSIVPQKVDGLLVVGRAASYDTLPHGSARVVPVGMAEGEAAGASVKLAIEQNLSFRELSASKEAIAKLQAMLNKQGMDLKPYTIKASAFMEHKSYEGLKTAVSLGLSSGGYKNEFDLDKASNQQRMVNMLEGMRKFKPTAMAGSASAVIAKVNEPAKLPLSLDMAAQMIASLLKQDATPANALSGLQTKGFLSKQTIDNITNKQELNNGDTYMLINDVYKQIKAAK